MIHNKKTTAGRNNENLCLFSKQWITERISLYKVNTSDGYWEHSALLVCLYIQWIPLKGQVLTLRSIFMTPSSLMMAGGSLRLTFTASSLD